MGQDRYCQLSSLGRRTAANVDYEKSDTSIGRRFDPHNIQSMEPKRVWTINPMGHDVGNLELPFPFYLGVAESAVHMCRLRDKAAYEKSSQALTRDV